MAKIDSVELRVSVEGALFHGLIQYIERNKTEIDMLKKEVERLSALIERKPDE